MCSWEERPQEISCLFCDSFAFLVLKEFADNIFFLQVRFSKKMVMAMFPVTSRLGHVGLFISVVGKNTTSLDMSY